MWPRFVNAALGVWLMAAPAVLGYDGPAEVNDRILGPVAATFAIVAIWEITRALRWVNLAAGLWLLAAPWLLGYGDAVTTANDMAVGAVLAALALVRGTVTQDFGGGWRALLQKDPPHLHAAAPHDTRPSPLDPRRST